VIPDPVPDSVDRMAVQPLDPTDAARVAEELAPPPQAEATQLVFEREVISYPSFQRRSPFQPLLTAEAGGPRFEDLRLAGVLLSSIPGQSSALFTIAQGPVQPGGLGPAEQTAARALRVRAGERVGLGNTVVVEIRDGLVIVDVEEFGARERRTMRVTRPGGGQGGL
jgi:hypothetical protein